MPRACHLVPGLAVVAVTVIHAAAVQQFGLLGLGPVESVKLEKEHEFDYHRTGSWDVFPNNAVAAGTAWIAHFTNSQHGDKQLTVTADAFKKAFDLPTDVIDESDEEARVEIVQLESGEEKMNLAVVHVRDHIQDVWDDFHRRAQSFMVNNKNDPESWKQGLKEAWKHARSDWDGTNRFHVLVFVDGLGDKSNMHKVTTVFKEGNEPKSVDREAKTDIAWFSTSIPIGNAGGSKSQLKVNVDDQEKFVSPEFEVLDDNTAWCGRASGAQATDQSQVVVAAFRSLGAARTFQRQVQQQMTGLWTEEAGARWKPDQLIALCQPAADGGIGGVADAQGGALAAGASAPLGKLISSPIKGHSEGPSEEGGSLALMVAGISVAAILLAVLVWFVVLRRSADYTRDQSVGSDMQAPDIHGDQWEMDGLSQLEDEALVTAGAVDGHDDW